MTSGPERFEVLNKASSILPPQGTAEWYSQRKLSANSSEYNGMFNVFGERMEMIKEAAVNGPMKKAPAMAWGSSFEDVSGYIFSTITGLSYREMGSQGHKDNPRIRGSVDGYGLDGDGKVFILETKTPYSVIPTPKISDLGYLYQMIQNMEVTDGDYGLFNNVRLLPCPTSLICDVDAACDTKTGAITQCSFVRYNLAKQASPPINLVAVGVTMMPDLEGGHDPDKKVETPEWIDNPFDAYTGAHETITLKDFFDQLVERKYKWVPFGTTTLRGEECREWAERMYQKAVGTGGMIGCAFMKVDAHNIERVPRCHEFWEKHLRPQAEHYLSDLDRVMSGNTIIDMPRLDKSSLPIP